MDLRTYWQYKDCITKYGADQLFTVLLTNHGPTIHGQQTTDLLFTDLTKHGPLFKLRTRNFYWSVSPWMVRVLSPGNMWLIWLSSGLTTRQPLWVIFCRLPEKGRRKIGNSKGDEREGEGRKENEWKWRNRRNKSIPSTFTCCKDSRPCPAISQYLLHDTFASPYHPTGWCLEHLSENSCWILKCFLFFNSAKVLIQQWANKMIVYGRCGLPPTTAILWTFGIKGK